MFKRLLVGFAILFSLSNAILRVFPTDRTERWYQGYVSYNYGMTLIPTYNYFGINNTAPSYHLDVTGRANATTLSCTDLIATNLKHNLNGTGYTITANKLTDGTSVFTGGNLTGGLEFTVVTLNATNIIATYLAGNINATGYTITATTGNFTNLGSFSGVDGNFSGTVTANKFTDGTAILTGGDLTGLETITVTTANITYLLATNLRANLNGTGYTITANKLTDGTAKMTGGVISGV